MKATTTATVTTITGADVLRALSRCAIVCALYALQFLARVFRKAYALTLVACRWLNSRHNFTDEDDPVYMTGWQYLGFGVVVCLACIALSIRVDY